MFQCTNVDHIAINTHDMEATLQFYCGVMGMRLARTALTPDGRRHYNVQIGGSDQQNMHVLVNSTNFWNEGGSNYSDGGSPCDAMMVDVKLTEADLPWFFGLDVVPAINARARVQIQSLSYANGGALPIAVPNTEPRRAKAYA